MTFVLGSRSLKNLAKVHPKLVDVVKRAIEISEVDFGVPEQSWRTIEEQREKVRRGVSKTMHSNHLLKDDGHGWAVDLVPYVNGRYSWDGNPEDVGYPFYHIAAAVREATLELGVDVVWGAVWDRMLGDLPPTAKDLLDARRSYNVRHPGRDFNDYPHFQLEGWS